MQQVILLSDVYMFGVVETKPSIDNTIHKAMVVRDVFEIEVVHLTAIAIYNPEAVNNHHRHL